MEKLTQKEKVLRYMKRYGKITTMDAFYKLNITRLAEMLRLLKKDGYVIDKKGITEHKPDGTWVYHEEFWISEEPE